MPFDVIRIQDRLKLTSKEVEEILKTYIANKLSRDVTAVEFHMGRNEFGAATIYLADESK